MPQPSLCGASSPPCRAKASSEARASVGRRLDIAKSSHISAPTEVAEHQAGEGKNSRCHDRRMPSDPAPRLIEIKLRRPRRRNVSFMSETLTFGVEVEQQEGFEFRVRFDWPQVAELLRDEPEPLGKAR